MDGQPAATGDPSRALERGVATIYQERDLVEDLTVAQSIYLGHELRRWDSWTAGGCGRRRSRSCAASTTRPSRRGPTSATCGRLVSRWYRSHALSRHVRLLIMDEPSAILDDSEIETMFGVVRRLTAEGVGVIHLPPARRDPRLGDRVTVLTDGRTVASGLPATTPPTSSWSTWSDARSVSSIPNAGGERHGRPGGPGCGGSPTSSTPASRSAPGRSSASAAWWAPGAASFLRAIYGVDDRDAGEVLVDGRRVPPGRPDRAITAGWAWRPRIESRRPSCSTGT